MWPKLRGQAGPAPNAGDEEPEPESDPQYQLISVPDDSNVKYPDYCSPTFFKKNSKLQNPLHDLLQYVTEVSKSAVLLYVCVRYSN
jgi:hypothetical protein